MLPDVDADDGQMSEERVLVGGRSDLKLPRGLVQALHRLVRWMHSQQYNQQDV